METVDNIDDAQNKDKEATANEKTSCKKICCLKKERKFSKAKQRKIAKIGLVSTLALTTASGFVRKGFGKKIHLASGLAFIAFAAWHANLYKSKKTEKDIVSDEISCE